MGCMYIYCISHLRPLKELLQDTHIHTAIYCSVELKHCRHIRQRHLRARTLRDAHWGGGSNHRPSGLGTASLPPEVWALQFDSSLWLTHVTLPLLPCNISHCSPVKKKRKGLKEFHIKSQLLFHKLNAFILKLQFEMFLSQYCIYSNTVIFF